MPGLAAPFSLKTHLYRAPETFDIVPNTVDIASRKNLAQVSKMLAQIASGKEFGEEDPCLHPLDKYVAEAIKQMRTWVFEGNVISNSSVLSV